MNATKMPVARRGFTLCLTVLYILTVVSLLVSFMSACGKGDKKGPTERPTVDDPASAPSASAPAAATERPATTRPVEVATRAPGADMAAQDKVSPATADGVPALDFTPVSRERVKEARALHGRALKAHRAKDYGEAETLYRQALTTDPGHVLARYNLACVFNMSGQHAAGLAVLRQFRDNGCPLCLSRLSRATVDSEWKSQWNKPEFDALTKDVVVKPTDVEAATKQVIAACESGDASTIEHLLHPRDTVRLHYGSMLCDPELDQCEHVDAMFGASGVIAGFKKWRKERFEMEDDPDPLRTDYDSIRCNKKCCSLDTEDREASHFYTDLYEICFEIDSGGAIYLDSIHTGGD